MQINSLLMAAGSHPAALLAPLRNLASLDHRAEPILQAAARVPLAAKEQKLLELLRLNRSDKTLVFANFRATLRRLAEVLGAEGLAFCTFCGDLSAGEKERAIETFRDRCNVMLCSQSGGEGFNLQFANTLVNFDLPWNPMRIEQRIGRVHRIGQKREVFVFNLCTAGSLEERILRLLNDKVRMFELVVGEIGSILGNLAGEEEFESLVLDLWLACRNDTELDGAFEQLGERLLTAQEEYLGSKQLDEALFGEDYE
jgi:SNF2 family DNA or RNA helicase